MKKNDLRRLAAAMAAVCLGAAAVSPVYVSASEEEPPAVTEPAGESVTEPAAAAVTDSTEVIVINKVNGTNVTLQNKTFEAYKIFSVIKIGSGANAEYAYTVEDAWVSFIEYKTGYTKSGNNEFDVQAAKWIQDKIKTTAEKQKFAVDLAAYAASENIAPLQTITTDQDVASIGFKKNNGTADTSDDITDGYYLIAEKVNDSEEKSAVSAFMLDTFDGEGIVELNLKANRPTIEKKIVEGNDRVDANSVGIGEVVTYEITSKVPDTTYYKNYIFTMHDKFSDGLTFLDKGTAGPTDDITVSIEDYSGTVNYSATLTNGKLDIVFDKAQMKLFGTSEADGGQGLAGKTITVQYKATVNKNAVIGVQGNPNTVNLEYSNNPTKSGSGEPDDENTTNETEYDTVKTFVTEVKLKKVDSAGNKLTGAEFSIVGTGTKAGYKYKVTTDTNGKATVTFSAPDDTEASASAVASVDDNGLLTFSGLGEGEYTITETKAPAGYNKLAQPITVTINCVKPAEISADGTADTDVCTWLQSATYNNEAYDSEKVSTDIDTGVITLTVVNKAGAIFPTTGGIGLIVLMIAGIAMLAGAGVLIAVKKKSAAE